MLDLFCGRGGWTNAFLERGWECAGIDIKPQPGYRGKFFQHDVLDLSAAAIRNFDGHGRFDFICASSPCEEFSVWGMRHFHPNPPYPELGVKLFEHTRSICKKFGIPYVMENVRAAQQFVGQAAQHSGSFYLWGSAVPELLPAGLKKGFRHKEMFAHNRTDRPGASATIPPELAHCVAAYAERILDSHEQTTCVGQAPIPSGQCTESERVENNEQRGKQQ